MFEKNEHKQKEPVIGPLFYKKDWTHVSASDADLVTIAIYDARVVLTVNY